jgi:adenosylcobinamide-GDP ribazoletransferase
LTMKRILLALQFLTIVPVHVKNVKNGDLPGSVAYFPVIGFLLGCVLAAIIAFGRYLSFPEIGVCAVMVIALAILTGGIHLDGLADLFDALGSRKSREEMLVIMRDSRVGAMGVLAISSALLLKTALLVSTGSPLRIGPVILMCVISRWAMVFLMYRFPYARKEGKAKIYLEGMNAKIFIPATVFTGIVSFLAGQIQGLIALAVTALIVNFAGAYLTKKFGGITGDVIGASNEIAEILCLFIMCL